MTTTYQTQCSHCQHVFAITEEQLAFKSGYARCGNCKKIFSALDNLIGRASDVQPVSPSPIPPAANPSSTLAVTPSTSSQPTAHHITSNIQDDLLFDDNIGLEPTHRQSDQTETFASDFEINENFDLQQTTIPTARPQTAVTDNDESWLNELLEKEKQSELQAQMPVADNKLTTINRTPNDVSNMLEELGVGVNYETAPAADEYLDKVNQRLAQQTSSQQRIKPNIGMTLVWVIGSLLLSALLAVQYIIFNLDELLKKPSTAASISSLCGFSPISCNLPSTDLGMLKTDILSTDAKGDKQSDIVFVLKNTASQRLIYPNLKIDLRAGNETKSQLVLTPAQYLSKDNTYLMPNQIQPVKLRIDYPKNSFDQPAIEPFY